MKEGSPGYMMVPFTGMKKTGRIGWMGRVKSLVLGLLRKVSFRCPVGDMRQVSNWLY